MQKCRERTPAAASHTGFWGRRQCAFFDVRVFHPNAQSYRHSSISSLCRHHEQVKKREYGDRIREVENGSFTPLVFATTGGMGREATLLYKCFADQISEKKNPMYSKTMAWIRCTLSFSLLLSAVMCIRDSHSTSHACTKYPMPVSNWVLQRASFLAKLITK